jgi:hypothetical protein
MNDLSYFTARPDGSAPRLLASGVGHPVCGQLGMTNTRPSGSEPPECRLAVRQSRGAVCRNSRRHYGAGALRFMEGREPKAGVQLFPAQRWCTIPSDASLRGCRRLPLILRVRRRV